MGGNASAPGQTISLPKGGGALHGLGETFSPDLHTGTGNFTVPIALPPGRNGFQPQLNLVYSTGNGDSPFGLGWNLSIPGVTRKTSKGIPRYDDEARGSRSATPHSLPGLRIRPGGRVGSARYGLDRGQKDYLRASYVIAMQATTIGKSSSKDGLVSLYGTPRRGPIAVPWTDPATIRQAEAGTAQRRTDLCVAV